MRSPLRHPVRLASVATTVWLGGCVSYDGPPAPLPELLATESPEAGGTLTFAEAVQVALLRAPELQALAAAAQAAGANVVTTAVQVEYQGDDDMVALFVDPIALARLGARGAGEASAAANAAAALAALGEARWRTAVAIAELFAVARVLRDLPVPTLAVDAGPFARSGLAAPAALQQLAAAEARLAAERAERARLARQNAAELCRMLGLPGGAAVDFVPAAADWPPQPEASRDALLARPDVAVAEANLAVADRQFALAVAEQYPMLQVGPGIATDGGPSTVMGMVRLPLGAGELARAARDRREAALHARSAAWRAAEAEAQAAEGALAAAEAAALAAGAQERASWLRLRAAEVGLATEVDAFGPFVDAAAMAVRDHAEHRAAAVELARARVRAAAAHGWPGLPPVATGQMDASEARP